MFSARYGTEVTGLGATDTYDNQGAAAAAAVALVSAAGCTYSCVVADSREGNTYWADDVAQPAGERREQ